MSGSDDYQDDDDNTDLWDRIIELHNIESKWKMWFRIDWFEELTWILVEIETGTALQGMETHSFDEIKKF